MTPRRRALMFGVALAACLTMLTPAASSAYAQPRPAAAHAAGQATSTFSTLCLHGTTECLNDRLCQFHTVQLWSISSGWKCALTATYVGTVNPAGWPYYCGQGLNYSNAGLPVFFVGDRDTVNVPVQYAVQSAGYGNTATLTPVSEPPDPNNIDSYIGYWVADHVNSNGTVTNAVMTDAFETCNDGTNGTAIYQDAYGGCGGSGCLVRENSFNSTGLWWDWDNVTISSARTNSSVSARITPAAVPGLSR